MIATRSKRWFEIHPKTTFVLLLTVFVLFLDFISAIIFIPFDYNSFRCPDPYFHHGLLPNQFAKNKWGAKIFDVYTNSLGFKDKKIRSVPSKAVKKRIIFIGDSFTECVGMSWEESFVGILDSQIPEVEILNAGVVSYSPKLYYLKIKYLLENISLHFDELCVLIDNSDILDEITYRDFEPYDHNFIKKSGNKLRKYWYKNSYIYFTISNFINNSRRNPITESWNPFSGEATVDESALHDDEFIAATLDWSYNKYKYDKWGIQGLKLAGGNMEMLIDLCRQHQVTVKVVIYPWPNLIQRNDLNNKQVRFWEQFCKQKNIPFINLYPDFISDINSLEKLNSYFIPGDVHWNELGNKYVADLLKKHMLPND